jgi:hypothetical protein
MIHGVESIPKRQPAGPFGPLIAVTGGFGRLHNASACHAEPEHRVDANGRPHRLRRPLSLCRRQLLHARSIATLDTADRAGEHELQQGDYTDIKRLTRARSFEFAPAELPSNPDFNTKSLRGNLVMRWEYVRGSALFLVWNMSTADASRPGVFSPFRDLADTFGADGTHVFMIKMN